MAALGCIIAYYVGFGKKNRAATVFGAGPGVPLIRHGLTPMPPSPLRGEGYSCFVGSARLSVAFPSSVTAAPCHLPPGEGFGRGTDCRVGALPLLAMTGRGMRALSAPCGGTSPEGGRQGSLGSSGLVLAPPVGELAAELTERAGYGLPRRGFAPPRNDRPLCNKVTPMLHLCYIWAGALDFGFGV